jgi:hypothetical protein
VLEEENDILARKHDAREWPEEEIKTPPEEPMNFRKCSLHSSAVENLGIISGTRFLSVRQQHILFPR